MSTRNAAGVMGATMASADPADERSPAPTDAKDAAPGWLDQTRLRWFNRLFGQTSEAVFVVSADLRIVWWGPRAEHLLGIPSAKAVGRRCYELVAGRHADGRAECRPTCWVMRAAQRGRSVPAFPIEIPSGGARRRFTAGFMISEAGDYLIHVFREVETPARSVPERQGGADPAGTAARADQLTPREREVLALITSGARSREIAQRLSISHATARNHVQNVLVKLGVHTRLEAALVALGSGSPTPPGIDRVGQE